MAKEIRVGLLVTPYVIQNLDSIFAYQANLILVPKTLHFKKFGCCDENDPKIDLWQEQVNFDPEILPDTRPL